MSYEDFIAQKRKRHTPSGFTCDADWPALFPHQKPIVRWALRMGKAAIFLDTGLGKTLTQLTWAAEVAAHTGGRVILFAPLAVGEQTLTEAARFGIDAGRVGSESPIHVINYDRIHQIDPADYHGVVLDECFAAGTMIDVVEHGAATKKPIEDIRVGDTIINAAGHDEVSDVHRREVDFAVRVSVGCEQIVCSPNHPWFTQRGWVSAQDLAREDVVLRTHHAVRMVRGDVLQVPDGGADAEVLREILLSEMADAPAGTSGEGPQPGGCGAARRGEGCVVQIGEPGIVGGTGEDREDDANVRPCRSGEDLPPIEGDRARTARTWRKRSRDDGSAADDAGRAGGWMGSRIELVVGPADSGLSHELQARLGPSRAENRRRGGWSLPQVQEGSGREEGRETAFARVDGAEILEQGHPDLDRFRDASGKLYFYDLGGTRHPSFSVSGILVHNSSILKSVDGRTRTMLIDSFQRTPYRLACTATPAPNDQTELGNHAEFLGICTRTEMLAEFFVHDGGATQDWRLKGHARRLFWEWVASWAVLVKKPSDLGFDDGAYNLPALHVIDHEVQIEAAIPDGMLFAPPAAGLNDQRKARRDHMAPRVQAVADLVASEPDEQWLIWCDLNDESDALADAIPGAVEVRGSDDNDTKRDRLLGFAAGTVRILITKTKIAGFGLNWQTCARMAFVGPTNSYESWYQAVRRCWRFGQNREVKVFMVKTSLDAIVSENLKEKAEAAKRMGEEMVGFARRVQLESVMGSRPGANTEATQTARIPAWLVTEAS